LAGKEFVDAIRHHSSKLWKIRNFLDLLEAFQCMQLALERGGHYRMAESVSEYADKLRQQVRHDNTQELRGFYVDLPAVQGGGIRVPSQITSEETSEMITLTRFADAVRLLLVEQRGLPFIIDDDGRAHYHRPSQVLSES
jgi:hypothetical protein